jgi:hypothetical protein
MHLTESTREISTGGAFMDQRMGKSYVNIIKGNRGFGAGEIVP